MYQSMSLKSTAQIIALLVGLLLIKLSLMKCAAENIEFWLKSIPYMVIL